MSNASDTMSYELYILRSDEKHISIIVDKDFKKVKEMWKELHSKWKECSDNNAPFTLEDPIVTAFNPALIFEIEIVPFSSERSVESDNPYEKRMRDRGFGNFNSGYPDLMDRGRS